MEFIVEFRTPDTKEDERRLPLVEKLGRPGIDMLDLIREEDEELKDVTAKNIWADTSCPIDGSSKSFSIGEDAARKSKLFTGKTYVTVVVPEAFLSRFIKFKAEKFYGRKVVKQAYSLFGVQIGKDKTERIVDSVNTKYTYKIEEIVSAWEDSGFPLKWGF